MLGQTVAIAARLMSLSLKFQSDDTALTFIRTHILDPEPSRNSLVALNALLFDPVKVLFDSSTLQEIWTLSLNASQNTDVRIFPTLFLH
jgi:hypothetical protein